VNLGGWAFTRTGLAAGPLEEGLAAVTFGRLNGDRETGGRRFGIPGGRQASCGLQSDRPGSDWMKGWSGGCNGRSHRTHQPFMLHYIISCKPSFAAVHTLVKVVTSIIRILQLLSKYERCRCRSRVVRAGSSAPTCRVPIARPGGADWGVSGIAGHCSGNSRVNADFPSQGIGAGRPHRNAAGRPLHSIGFECAGHARADCLLDR